MIWMLMDTAPAQGPAEGSRRHFHHTVTTEAAPEEVWRRWTDVTTWPAWDTEVERVELEGPIGLGVEGTLVSGGRASRFTISAWEPPLHYAFTTRLPLGSLVVDRRLEPLDDGGTRFTHDVRFTGVGGALLAPLLGGGFRAALPGVMARLAELAEKAGSEWQPASSP